MNTNSLLFSQEVNYSEVNVFGWGHALDRGVPAFMDIDSDGFMDLLVGTNDGRIWHLEQAEGNEFAVVNQRFSDIYVGSEASPVFTNIDNDGLIDLVVGENSDINWFEQEEINSNTFVFVSDQLVSIDIGAHWVPALYDLNNDGLLELIIGESLGNLNYFEQDSINAGTFSLVTENWLNWDGGTYVHPHFSDFNDDGLLDLLVGENTGKIFHLVQDDTNATTFHQVNEMFAGIDIGESAAPVIIDIDNDNKSDLFIGEWYNGLFHYEQIDSLSEEYVLVSDQIFNIRDFGYAIGFAVDDIDSDGLLDMLVSSYKGSDSYIVLLEQQETGSLNFEVQDEQFNDIEVRNYTNLTLYDINGNGLMDLLVGGVLGYVSHYEQDEKDSYNFSLVNEEFNNKMKVNQTSHLTFRDIDGDSLLDMISGEGAGLLLHYEQDNINAHTFTKTNSRFLDLDVGWYSSPEFTDIDSDSLLDLIIGTYDGDLLFYEQSEKNSMEFQKMADEFASVFVETRSVPRFADVNNDGKTDLFVAENSGGITLHLRNDDLDVTAPDTPQNLITIVNSETVDLSWSASQAEDLILYNIYRSVRNDTAVAEYLSSVNSQFTTFTDSTIKTSGTYYYWITALDLVGNESAFSLPDSISIQVTSLENDLLIKSFSLSQNYPNPFNPVTTIEYSVGANYNSPTKVDLSIYNLLGKKVATLVSQKQPVGSYKAQWDASGFSSGVYFYRLETNQGFVQTRKLILMK